MKYQEFKELILKIDINDVEIGTEAFNKIEREMMIKYLHNLANAFEAKMNLKVSGFYIGKKIWKPAKEKLINGEILAEKFEHDVLKATESEFIKANDCKNKKKINGIKH